MWHRVYDAVFYISTIDRRPADIPRASYDRASNLYCNLYYCSLQEIAVTVVKESTMRAHLTSRMHESPSILLRSELSRYSSFRLQVEPCENLIVASIWSRHSGRTEKSIYKLFQLLVKAVTQAKSFASKRCSRKNLI